MAKIHSIKISNYRGIKNFEHIWGLTNFICLIGRGDSGKTTLLEAIAAVLSPNWNLSFYDTDFYNCDIKHPISIEASIYDFPDELKSDAKYGLFIRGLNSKTGEIFDEIEEDHDAILTIKLEVHEDLEPKWYVISNREYQEPVEIKAKDREKFNVFFVSDYIDRHFSWNHGAPLCSILKQQNDRVEHDDVLLEAAREMKSKIDENDFRKFASATEKITANAKSLGSNFLDITTTIDIKDIAMKDGRMCLHDNNIPLRQKGKGSKRLMSMAIQTEIAKSDGIILIDEIEQGLEPDRVRNLVHILREPMYGQVFLTTHSSDVLVELDASNLFLMRKNSSHLTRFDGAFQGCIRKNPHAFFSKRLIVCEGATEIGICRAINQQRIARNQSTYALLGVGIFDGSGSSFIDYCEKLCEAGFTLCIFCDSDVTDVNKKKNMLRAKKLTIVDCEEGKAIEQQLFDDLPWAAVQELIQYSIDDHGIDSVRASLENNYIGKKLPTDWKKEDTREIRDALGKAAAGKQKNGKGWFKRIDHGEFIGGLCFKYLNEIGDKKIGHEISELNLWAFNE